MQNGLSDSESMKSVRHETLGKAEVIDQRLGKLLVTMENTALDVRKLTKIIRDLRARVRLFILLEQNQRTSLSQEAKLYQFPMEQEKVLERILHCRDSIRELANFLEILPDRISQLYDGEFSTVMRRNSADQQHVKISKADVSADSIEASNICILNLPTQIEKKLKKAGNAYTIIAVLQLGSSGLRNTCDLEEGEINAIKIKLEKLNRYLPEAENSYLV